MKSDTIEHTYLYIRNHYKADEVEVEIALVEVKKTGNDYTATFSTGETFKLVPMNKHAVMELIDCRRCGNVFDLDAKDIYDTKEKYKGYWFCDECANVIDERERIKNNQFGRMGYIGMPKQEFSLRK